MGRRRFLVVPVNLGDAPPGNDVAVMLVVDDSGSMAGKGSKEAREGLRRFVEQTPEGTRIGLVGFGSEVTRYSAPTEHRDFVFDQVERFRGDGGLTALYDAVGRACAAFDPQDRHKCVVVLTDGQDCNSKEFSLCGGDGKRDLLEAAIASGVRVFSVACGEGVDEESLRLLAERTGGKLLQVREAGALAGRLLEVLELIVTTRGETLFRPEVERLLRESLGTRPPWFEQLSLDEWDEEEPSSDATHIRFPRTSTRTDRKLKQACGALSDILAGTDGLLARLLIGQAQRVREAGTSPQADLDVVLVGWLSDPAFRVLSLSVVTLMRQLMKNLPEYLPGDLFLTFLPLLQGWGSADNTERNACAAWLTAVSNLCADVPHTILQCGQTNQHRILNKDGYVGQTADQMLQQAANLTRLLAIAPADHEALVKSCDRSMVQGLGAASLSSELGGRLDRVALPVFEETLSAFRQRGSVQDTSALVRRSVTDAGLDFESLKAEFLAPRAIDAGPLAEVRFDVAMFWPPRTPPPEEDYLAVLPRLLEERAGEFLLRKLQALRNLLAERANTKLEHVSRAIADQLDAMLWGEGASGVAAVREVLAGISSAVGSQRARLRDDGAVTFDLEQVRLFSADERVTEQAGTLSRAQARESLDTLLQNRPAPEALALRHGLLAIALGVTADQLLRLTPQFVFNPGLLGVPAFGAALVAGACLALGFVRWRLNRKRLERAVREYVAAIVREARAAARSECVAGLRSFYDRLQNWIGSNDNPAPWDPEAVRDEQHLSQRHLLACLEQRLEEYTRTLAARVEADHESRAGRGEPDENWFVWRVVDPGHGAGAPHLAALPAEAPPPAEVPWNRIATVETGWHHWREVCRRKRCDRLDEYLEFHRVRLDLPRQLWLACREEVARLEHHRSQLAIRLRNASDADRRRLSADLHATAFPSIMLADGASLTAHTLHWVADKAAAGSLHKSAEEGVSAAVEPTVEDHEAHLAWLFRVPIFATREWQTLREPWSSLATDERKQWLEIWGDPAGWLDPVTGEPCVASPAGLPGPESTGQGSADEGEVL